MSQRPTSTIPEPRLRTVENLTPFRFFQCDKMAPGRRFYDTVVVKGTFDLAPGTLRIAEVQAPIALADDYWDLAAPERSSVKHAGEAVLVKPSTDVLVTGALGAPEGRPTASWDAAIVMKDGARTVLDYVARVTGPRRWRHGLVRGWVLDDPEPTTQVPIRYELAYGGAYLERGRAPHRWIAHAPNPSGTGFFDEDAMDPDAAYAAPQWEPPRRPVTGVRKEVPLTGFGPIARPWTARLQYAGTYDDAWLAATREDVANGLPADYAADFDPRFFQCAHPALITAEHARGDEHLALGGMLRDHPRLVAQLPGVIVQARMLDGWGRWLGAVLPLDTIHVDLDARTVHLCWRLTLDQELDIRAAVLTHVEAE